eukprot:Amastigsp_a516838_5.p3 type:complete len:188 gc:universal Amastigsp_a516838_5:386-949(+)
MSGGARDDVVNKEHANVAAMGAQRSLDGECVVVGRGVEQRDMERHGGGPPALALTKQRLLARVINDTRKIQHDVSWIESQRAEHRVDARRGVRGEHNPVGVAVEQLCNRGTRRVDDVPRRVAEECVRILFDFVEQRDLCGSHGLRDNAERAMVERHVAWGKKKKVATGCSAKCRACRRHRNARRLQE